MFGNFPAWDRPVACDPNACRKLLPSARALAGRAVLGIVNQTKYLGASWYALNLAGSGSAMVLVFTRQIY